jgi:hypothetical protein
MDHIKNEPTKNKNPQILKKIYKKDPKNYKKAPKNDNLAFIFIFKVLL